jgi:hypothetical protein
MLSALRKIQFSVQILLGLVLGVALGYVARVGDVGWLGSTLDTIGSLFVQLLKLAVPPLVFTAIVVSVVSLRGVANAARLAVKTLLWFGITAAIAVTIGIGLGLFTNPGRGVTPVPVPRGLDLADRLFFHDEIRAEVSFFPGGCLVEQGVEGGAHFSLPSATSLAFIASR